MSQTNGYLSHTIKRKLGRSAFNTSEGLALTMEQGELTPTFIHEVYPKFTVRDALSQDIELAPQLTPFKGRIAITNSAWFVPNRILWDDWEKFINPYHPDEYRVPVVTPYGVMRSINNNEVLWSDEWVRGLLGPGSLWDYITKAPCFNLSDLAAVGPDGIKAGDVEVNALFFRAYYKIWFDNYRDQNFHPETDEYDVQGSALVPMTSSVVTAGEIRSWFQRGNSGYTSWTGGKYRPFRKAWRRDYFTSALPWPQRGEAVPIPGASAGVVVSTGKPVQMSTTYPGLIPRNSSLVNAGDITKDGLTDVSFQQDPYDATFGPDGQVIQSMRVQSLDSEGKIATMRDLTIAERIQRVFERAARSGGRYKEFLQGFFGTTNRDDRLQRPEHLGAHTVEFDGSTVIQVSADTSDSAQGNLAGYARQKGRNLRHKSFFSEHGIVMYLCYTLPTQQYAGGLARQFRKLARYDYAFPDFEDIGEQAIMQSEIYAPWMPNGTTSDIGANQEFGYSPRYADLKCGINRICGDFMTTLNPWTQARMFHDPYPREDLNGEYYGIAPRLNRGFVYSDPSKRIFPSQVVGDDVLWCGFVLERKVVMPFKRFVLPKLS